MKIGFYVIAILLGVSGAALFMFASHYSMLKPLGMVLVALSAYCFRLTGKQKSSNGGKDFDSTMAVDSTAPKESEILARCLGLIAVFAVVASYIFLRRDALNGGHQVWPAYAFTVSVLFGALIWSYIFAKSIFKKR